MIIVNIIFYHNSVFFQFVQKNGFTNREPFFGTSVLWILLMSLPFCKSSAHSEMWCAMICGARSAGLSNVVCASSLSRASREQTRCAPRVETAPVCMPTNTAPRCSCDAARCQARFVKRIPCHFFLCRHHRPRDQGKDETSTHAFLLRIPPLL